MSRYTVTEYREGSGVWGIATLREDGTISTWRPATPEQTREAADALMARIQATPACVECGDYIGLVSENYEPKTAAHLTDLGTCFGCGFWLDHIADAENGLVYKGERFQDAGARPDHTPRQCLGFGGARWRITKGGKTWETNNLYTQGEIPERFRDRLPDNCTLEAIS